MRGGAWATGLRAARAQPPFAWTLPKTAVRFGRPAHGRRSGDSSCGSTRALILPRDADGDSRYCLRRRHTRRALLQTLPEQPSRPLVSLPGRCERLRERPSRLHVRFSFCS